MGYSFKTQEDIKRVVDATKKIEGLGDSTGGNIIKQDLYLAKVKEIVDSGTTTSGQQEIKATQIVFSSNELGMTTIYEPDEAFQWDTDLIDAPQSAYNIRIVEGQPLPSVDDIIEVFQIEFDLDSLDPSEAGWFFKAFIGGGGGDSFFQAITTGYYSDGVVADIYSLNQNVQDQGGHGHHHHHGGGGTTPIASNQEIQMGAPGSPTYLSLDQAFVVMQQSTRYLPLGFVTI